MTYVCLRKGLDRTTSTVRVASCQTISAGIQNFEFWGSGVRISPRRDSDFQLRPRTF